MIPHVRAVSCFATRSVITLLALIALTTPAVAQQGGGVEVNLPNSQATIYVSSQANPQVVTVQGPLGKPRDFLSLQRQMMTGMQSIQLMIIAPTGSQASCDEALKPFAQKLRGSASPRPDYWPPAFDEYVLDTNLPTAQGDQRAPAQFGCMQTGDGPLIIALVPPPSGQMYMQKKQFVAGAINTVGNAWPDPPSVVLATNVTQSTYLAFTRRREDGESTFGFGVSLRAAPIFGWKWIGAMTLVGGEVAIGTKVAIPYDARVGVGPAVKFSDFFTLGAVAAVGVNGIGGGDNADPVRINAAGYYGGEGLMVIKVGSQYYFRLGGAYFLRNDDTSQLRTNLEFIGIDPVQQQGASFNFAYNMWLDEEDTAYADSFSFGLGRTF